MLDSLHKLIKGSMLASASRAVGQKGAHLPSEEPDLRLTIEPLYNCTKNQAQVILEFHKLRSPLSKWPKFEATKRAGGPRAKPPNPSINRPRVLYSTAHLERRPSFDCCFQESRNHCTSVKMSHCKTHASIQSPKLRWMPAWSAKRG